MKKEWIWLAGLATWRPKSLDTAEGRTESPRWRPCCRLFPAATGAEAARRRGSMDMEEEKEEKMMRAGAANIAMWLLLCDVYSDLCVLCIEVSAQAFKFIVMSKIFLLLLSLLSVCFACGF
jgi:hypothetical protein